MANVPNPNTLIVLVSSELPAVVTVVKEVDAVSFMLEIPVEYVVSAFDEKIFVATGVHVIVISCDESFDMLNDDSS